MAQQEDNTDQKYRSLRKEFDDLQLEEKAVFLIESGLSLFIHSVESLTHFVRDEINKMADGMKEHAEKDPEENEEEKKEEQKEDVPRKTAAKPGRRKSTAAKKTTRKSAPKDEPASEKADDDAESVT